MTRLTLDPVFGSYPLVVVAALLLLGLLALGPGSDRLSRLKRAALLVLRLATILLVLAALLRPTLVYTETKRQSATLLVMADQSRSMSVKDGIGGKSRWELLRRTVADAESELGALAEDFELKAYAFDSEAYAAEIEGGKIALAENPEGNRRPSARCSKTCSAWRPASGSWASFY